MIIGIVNKVRGCKNLLCQMLINYVWQQRKIRSHDFFKKMWLKVIENLELSNIGANVQKPIFFTEGINPLYGLSVLTEHLNDLLTQRHNTCFACLRA